MSRTIADFQARGFARLTSADTSLLFGEAPNNCDWASFAGSWENLPLDEHMGDGGRYRRRRHAVFGVAGAGSATVRAPHRPHFQTREFNSLNGGIERWFAPITDDVEAMPIFASTLRIFTSLASAARGSGSWQIEVHQFRIEPGAGKGKPTPEGLHRDGVDLAFILLVARAGISGGVTNLVAPDNRRVSRFTMANPGESLMLDDWRLRHGVSPIRASAEGAAHRDTLVVTFKRVHGS